MNDRAEADDDASGDETGAEESTPADRSTEPDPTAREDDTTSGLEADSPADDTGPFNDGVESHESDADSPETDVDESASERDSRGNDAEEIVIESDARDDGTRSDDALADDTRADDAESANEPDSMPGVPEPDRTVPEDVRKYERFKKMDGAQYDRVNEFLRDRTYVTAREWAIARLCADFRTETGVEMTKIGENLPDLVPFMTDTYTPQAVNQARSSFDEKVRKAGATFLYGAMCDFYTAEDLDDVMYEVTEVSKFLLEVEGVDLSVEDELEAEERISSVMREVRRASKQLREEETFGEDERSETAGEDEHFDSADDVGAESDDDTETADAGTESDDDAGADDNAGAESDDDDVETDDGDDAKSNEIDVDASSPDSGSDS